MTLKDIIKNESDRIFHVDPECFIIFTGNSLTDIQPFIRLGNWIDMPIELIPLMENIIISDLKIGNPSYEQFNIDVKYLPKNRYIGGNTVINKFLNFQKIFGLDLKNANFINAEKDIPAIPKKKNISDRESFLGIFYRDGNFKIKQNNKDLFDLKKYIEFSQDEYTTHQNIHQNSKNQNRYNSNGFAIIDNNPIFFSNNNFVSYLFPRNYFKQFNSLSISPRKISTVIHPSSNFIGLTKFIKWKHFSSSKVNIFTDYQSKITAIKEFFNNIQLNLSPFSSMQHVESEKLKIKNIPDTYNLEINSEDINFGYIKSRKGIEVSLKNNYDFILISYSAFEDALLPLKSYKKPVIIHDDGNPNVKKLGRIDNTILIQNAQYNLSKEDIDLNSHYRNIISSDIFENFTNLEEKVSEINSYDDITRFNILSYLQFKLFTTSSRKTSSTLKNVISYINHDFTAKTSEIIITLHITKIAVFQSASGQQKSNEEQLYVPSDIFKIDFEKNAQIPNFVTTIIEDRIRLKNLLKLYSSQRDYKNEIKELKKAINERKAVFKNEFLTKNHAQILNLDSIFETPDKLPKVSNKKQNSILKKIFSSKIKSENSNPNSQDHNDSTKANSEKNFLSSRKMIIFLLLIILTAVLIIGSFFIKNGYNKYMDQKKQAEKEIIRVEKEKIMAENEKKRLQKIEAEKKEKKQLREQYSITVSNKDIFLYANDIAVKNGYDPFPNTSFKNKNPNWIFPGNKFIFPDDKFIIVKDGDTLWGICESKLMEMYYDFFKVVKEIENTYEESKTYEKNKIKILEEKAYTPRQKNELEKLKKHIGYN